MHFALERVPARLTSGISGYFLEYLLDRPDVKDVWKTFVHHPFVMALGNGTLPLESFKGYIIQDYLYLVSAPSDMSHLHTPEARVSTYATLRFISREPML